MSMIPTATTALLSRCRGHKLTGPLLQLRPKLVLKSPVTQLLRIVRVGTDMTNTASAMITRRIARATSIRRLGTCRSPWLTTCLACAAWCFGSCLVADAAVANRQPTVATTGHAIEQVVFDADNMPWATFQRESPGKKSAFIARLTKRYRLIQAQQVPCSYHRHGAINEYARYIHRGGS